MHTDQRSRMIEAYRTGYAEVMHSLDDIGQDQLDTMPSDGGWTVREIVHHLADSEMTSAIRLRRLLAEEKPRIGAYDQEEFARRLHYGSRPIDASLDALKAARETTAEILERMSDADWLRQGSHDEISVYTPEVWLEIYARHARDHAEQIRRVRGN